MGTPKYAERVVKVETRLNIFLDQQFPEFQKTVTKSFADLGEQINAASLNGETPRVKNLSKELGDPADVQILASMVESHKRWGWALGPFRGARTGVVNAALWISTGLAVGAIHAAIQARWPFIP